MLRTLCFAGLLMASHSAVHAEWGRLFFTPQQRDAIDLAQQRPRQASHPLLGSATSTNWNYYNGSAQRNGGYVIHWINGQPSHKVVPPLSVKPGEYWDPQRTRISPAGSASD